MQRSTNRKRTLIVSAAIILLAMTIIVGTTFALFTDTQTVSNHLQAGTLEVTLKRRTYKDHVDYRRLSPRKDFPNSRCR